MSKSKIAAAVAMVVAASPLLAAAPVAGRWTTADGKAVVEIARCGPKICGTVVKVIKPNTAKGSRLAPGFVLMSDFTDDGPHWEGTIQVPQNGKSIAGQMMRQPDGQLQLSGCILFICKTQILSTIR